MITEETRARTRPTRRVPPAVVAAATAVLVLAALHVMGAQRLWSVDDASVVESLKGDRDFREQVAKSSKLRGPPGADGPEGATGRDSQQQGEKGDTGPPGDAPVGVVVAWPADPGGIPKDWLPCDGRVFDKGSYPELAGLLGDSRVPDYRGYFLRGIDPTGEVDPERDREPGHVQEDEVGSHVHGYQWKDYMQGGGNQAGDYNWQGTKMVNEKTMPSGGRETRPKNVAVHWLVKAR